MGDSSNKTGPKSTGAVPKKSTTTTKTSNLSTTMGDKVEGKGPKKGPKASRKLTGEASTSKPAEPLYDEKGCHIASGWDLCDCLEMECPGCHFECLKCGSEKCGPTCRVKRNFMYEKIRYERGKLVVENPFEKM